MPEKPRIVFDCNIFWQMFLSKKGVGAKCKILLDEGKIILFVSPEILAEVKDVLTRPETQNRFSQATDENVDAFLKDIFYKSILLKSVPQKFSYVRDPKDECYINLAIEIEADYIVSRDRDLLDLMTGIDIESKEFRQKSKPLKIVEPIEFIKIIAENLE